MTSPALACSVEPLVIAGLTDTISQGEKITMIVFYAILVLSIIVNAFIFIHYKKRYARTKVRVTMFMLLYAIAALTLPSGYFLPTMIGHELVPCWLSFALPTFSLGFFNAASFSRNATFMLMTKLSIATFTYGRVPIDETSKIEQEWLALGFFAQTWTSLKYIVFGLRLIFKSNGVKDTPSRDDHIMTLVCLRYITSTRGSLLLSFLCILPYFVLVAIVCLSFPPFALGCYGCSPNNDPTNFAIVSLGGLLLLNAIFFAIKCRPLADVWGVFAEGRLSARGIILAYVGVLLVAFGQTHIPNRYYASALAMSGFAAGFFCASGYQVWIAGSREHQQFGSSSSGLRKRQINDGSSHPENGGGSKVESLVENAGALTSPVADLKAFTKLNEILSSPDLLRAFEFHLSLEFGSENLSFLQDVSEWRNSFGDVAKTASLARARKIISTYIKDGGLNQVNLPSDLRTDISDSVEGTSGPPVITQNLFDRARSEIANLLTIGSVMRFSKSTQYTNYISSNMVVQNLA